MSQLTNEDNLRLNVLLHQDMHALRIDEGKMIVYGLTAKGEAKVKLNPNCKDEKYLRFVKEIISSHVLGSPGGYPVFLKRWTCMGQARDSSLESLLKLGEPEAVVATVHAQGLSDELARRAWWCMPCSEHARRMLEKEQVVEGDMGKVLADFLLEFLPFEEEPRDIVESVRLVLQPGLISEEQKMDLWTKGQRKNAFRVGFLFSLPDALPEQIAAHSLYASAKENLQPLIEQNNLLAIQLLRTLSATGQTFLHTVLDVMKKPSNQDVVVALMNAIGHYYANITPDDSKKREMDAVITDARSLCAGEYNSALNEDIRSVLKLMPTIQAQLEALLSLAWINESIVNPVFATTDAVGTVMRKKLEPVFVPLSKQCACLYGG